MFPIDQHSHVTHRLDRLSAEAAAERVAAAQRTAHRDEHRRHPGLHHDHDAGSIRARVGRLVIAVGIAIAGSTAEADARHAA